MSKVGKPTYWKIFFGGGESESKNPSGWECEDRWKVYDGYHFLSVHPRRLGTSQRLAP